MKQLTAKLKGKILVGIICTVIVLAGALLLPPLIRTAQAATSGDYTYTVNAGGTTATITGYTGAGGDITIPDTMTDGTNKYTVTAIGDGAFQGITAITQVVIPETVTTIGEKAFYQCTSLESAYFLGKLDSVSSELFKETAPEFTLYYHISNADNWSGFTGYATQAIGIVAFNANNGTDTKIEFCDIGSTILEPAAPQKAGYIFNGWFSDEACSLEWSFQDDAITGDTVLYAKWIDPEGDGITDINGCYSISTTGYATGLTLPTEEEQAIIDENAENCSAGNVESFDAFMAESLPKAVDNSTQKYFPQIGNQGSLGSCAAFSTTYYLMTYATAQARDWDVKSGGYNMIFSPKWAYNLCNNGADQGSYPGNIAYLMEQYGALTWSEFPYDNDYLEWPSTAEQWESAIKYCIDGYGFIEDINTDQGLLDLKTALNDGMIVEMMTDSIYGWMGNNIKDNPDSTLDDSEVGKWAAYYMIGSNSRHTLVIVGYNDDIWIDRDNDNVREDGELGAFRVANSWGAGWGDGGFAWFSYAAITDTLESNGHNGIMMDNQVMYLTTSADDYIPLVTAEVTLTTAHRDDLQYFYGINWPETTLPDSETRYDWNDGYFKFTNLANSPFYNNGGDYSFAGTSDARTGTILVDFTDVVTGEQYGAGNHDWTVEGGELSFCMGILDSEDGDTPVTVNRIIIKNWKTGEENDVEELRNPQTYDDDFYWFHTTNVLNPGIAAPSDDAVLDSLPVITAGSVASATSHGPSDVIGWKFVPDATGTYLFDTDNELICIELQNSAGKTMFHGDRGSNTFIRATLYAGETYILRAYLVSAGFVSESFEIEIYPIDPLKDADTFKIHMLDYNGRTIYTEPEFQKNTTSYIAYVPEWNDDVRVYPVTESEHARIIIDGEERGHIEFKLELGESRTVNIRTSSLDGSNSREYTVTIIRPTSPLIPTITSAIFLEYNKIQITWNKVSGASSYEVWSSTSTDGPYQYRDTIVTNTFADGPGINVGTTYYYKVRKCYYDGSTRAYGEFSPSVAVTPLPSTPSATTAAITSYNSIKVSWNTVSGASGYQLYRAISPDGNYSLLKTTTAVSYTNTSLKTGTTYYYKVRAYQTVGRTKVYGNYSIITAATPVLSSVASATASAYYPTSVKVSWSSVPGRTSYEVWRSTSPNNGFTLIKTTSSTSFKDTTLTPFVTYYYQIKVYRTVSRQKIYGGSVSPTASATPILGNVTGVRAAMSSASSNKLSWASVTGASGYEIWRSTTAGSGYVLVKSTSGRSYTDSNLIPNTTYYYQVRAYRKVGSSPVPSALSAPVSATPYFGSVTNPRAVRSSTTKIKLTWSAVSGRTGYEIYRSTLPDSGFVMIKSTTSTSFTDSNLTTGVTYYYKICAYRTVNTVKYRSADSVIVSAMP